MVLTIRHDFQLYSRLDVFKKFFVTLSPLISALFWFMIKNAYLWQIKNVKTMKKVFGILRYATIVAIMISGAESANAEHVLPLTHPKVGTTASSANGDIKLTIAGQKNNWGNPNRETNDPDIMSPKSAHFHPNGKKYYVNSLEGCRTVVFDAQTNEKVAVVHHNFNSSHSHLWSKPSGLYNFTHYSKDLNTFAGRPVESAFSHGGRYLWVPFYRRSFDLNAQDPSALAVIDTEVDTIVKLMETGPLPKMIACSPDGRYIAVAHWGNNTVGLINIESNDPAEWHHEKCLVVDYELKLNLSMTTKVNRDVNSGYMLRGTVFTPDNHYLLVGCMGGSGGIAVIDMTTKEYLGRLTGVHNARHLIIKNGYLYASLNSAGIVQRLPLEKVYETIGNIKNQVAPISGWQQCHVGTGTRTIESSPSGNYIFAACNSSSKLCVVDTRTMTMVASIPIDSYPVGLAVSADGRHAIVTSQARPGSGGGNAVNLVDVEYATAEPYVSETPPPAHPEVEPADSVAAEQDVKGTADGKSLLSNPILWGAAAVVLIALIALILRRKKK